jgi:hypothetical protein
MTSNGWTKQWTGRFFLAGIMQGSHREAVLHDQLYRRRLVQHLQAGFPAADIYDPLADHGESLSYEDGQGKEVFFRHNRMCREVDVLVAVVPEASMGTAIEMWEAYRHGRLVLTISPLQHNWTVKYCSHAVYPDLAAFESALASGEIACRIAQSFPTDHHSPAARDSQAETAGSELLRGGP